MEFSDILLNANQAVFSPDSNFFALSNGYKIIVKTADAKNNVLVFQVPDMISHIEFSPDSQLVLVCVAKRSYVEARSLNDEHWSCKIEDQASGILYAKWSPDSRSILTFSDFQLKVTVYSLTDSSQCTIRNPKYPDHGFCFTRDGKWFALAERREAKDYVGIYNTRDWKLVNHFQVDTVDLADIDWTSDNSAILVWDTYLNYKLLAYCPAKGQIGQYQAYQYALGIKNVQISPNSHYVAVGSYDEKVRLINALTWRPIIEFDLKASVKGGPQAQKQLTVFIEEEQRDTANQNNVYYRYVISEQFKPQFQKPKDAQQPHSVNEIAWSYDNNFIACTTTSLPNTVFVWEVPTLELRAVLHQLAPVRGLAWSKTSLQLVLCTGKNRIFFWSPDGASVCDLPFEGKPFNVFSLNWSASARSLLLHDKTDTVVAYPPPEITGYESIR